MAILMPGLSPKLLRRNNLVVIEDTLERTMEDSIIDRRAMEWDEECDFGDWIRSR